MDNITTTSVVAETSHDIEELQKNHVPYIVFESTIARFERTIRRLILLIVVTIVLFFATNAIWIYEWNQYEYTNVTVDSQDGSNAAYMGDGASGVINNGESGSSEAN